MELKIIESDRDSYPLKAMLIRGSSVTECLKEIQRLGYTLTDLRIHLLPGNVPNTIWGCVVISANTISRDQSGRHELCQEVCPNLLIPERSILFPIPTSTEFEKLFSTASYIVHPDFGWVELSEYIDTQSLIDDPILLAQESIKPLPSSFVPMKVRSFQIHCAPPEEVLQNLERKVVPNRKAFEDKPLNVAEVLRLKFYQTIFSKKADSVNSASATTNIRSLWMANLLGLIGKRNKMQQDFEELEERNKKTIDRLMELLKNNPDDALSYAIPLDDEGSTRGGRRTHLELSRRWFDFSLSNSSKNVRGSGTVEMGDHFHELHKQYHLTASELIKRKDYQKAAFVYMMLLKNYGLAAETLVSGKHYQEAATVFLKHCGDKLKAAECFEKGNIIMDAIKLYMELNDNEKVGDLYMTISNKELAVIHYEKVVASYKAKGQYVKAALIYRNKINNPLAGQTMLLEGWRTRRDAVNCLTNYFSNIENADHLHKALNAVYRNDVDEKNAPLFLSVIKHEFRKTQTLKHSIKEMAYEVVSKNISSNPSIVSELKNFNPDNKELFKDTLRFRLSGNLKKQTL
jgi:tetratricopeptide (TPR) repeat protein